VSDEGEAAPDGLKRARIVAGVVLGAIVSSLLGFVLLGEGSIRGLPPGFVLVEERRVPDRGDAYLLMQSGERRLNLPRFDSTGSLVFDDSIVPMSDPGVHPDVTAPSLVNGHPSGITLLLDPRVDQQSYPPDQVYLAGRSFLVGFDAAGLRTWQRPVEVDMGPSPGTVPVNQIDYRRVVGATREGIVLAGSYSSLIEVLDPVTGNTIYPSNPNAQVNFGLGQAVIYDPTGPSAIVAYHAGTLGSRGSTVMRIDLSSRGLPSTLVAELPVQGLTGVPWYVEGMALSEGQRYLIVIASLPSRSGSKAGFVVVDLRSNRIVGTPQRGPYTTRAVTVGKGGDVGFLTSSAQEHRLEHWRFPR